jgi:RNA polymerase sigma-70 factor (ECF subfamily)
MTLSAKESEHIISQAIETLPAQRKIIYRLNREQYLSYDEIARALRISRHTVKIKFPPRFKT